MWFWLAFASAFFGAADVILNKKVLHKVSPALSAWSLFALSIPPLIFLSLREGMPALNLIFFLSVFASSLVFVFARTIFNDALKQNLISKILPLTAFSGIFTYIFGLMFLSESIRPIPLFGLLSIVFGILFLNSIVVLIIGLLIFNAYGQDGPVALVMGVKRLQIFFILLMGYLFFKDKPTKHVWIATAIMILGVLMIKVG